MDPNEIISLIEQSLTDCRAHVHTDGQGHYEAVVVSPQFEGKRTLARHQLVYGALGKLVGNEIHALQIKTLTPLEWESAGNGAD